MDGVLPSTDGVDSLPSAGTGSAAEEAAISSKFGLSRTPSTVSGCASRDTDVGVAGIQRRSEDASQGEDASEVGVFPIPRFGARSGDTSVLDVLLRGALGNSGMADGEDASEVGVVARSGDASVPDKVLKGTLGN
jgi:hypothetical protein